MFTEYLFSTNSSACSKLSFSKLKRSFISPSFRNFEMLSKATCTNTVQLTVATIYRMVFNLRV